MPFMFSLIMLEMSTGPPPSNSMPWHADAASGEMRSVLTLAHGAAAENAP